MNLYVMLLVGLAVVNAAAVLVLARSGVARVATPVVQMTTNDDAGDPLQDLLQEAEGQERDVNPQRRGEARLAETLGRWRKHGEHRPVTAESCRLQVNA